MVEAQGVMLLSYAFILYFIMEEDSYRNILDNTDPDSNHYGDYDVNFMPYDLDSLKNNIKLDDGFNIFHHNSRSLLCEDRLVNYGVILDSINNPLHLIGFTETWLILKSVKI